MPVLVISNFDDDSLMMNRSKMNELAWKQHFSIISIWGNFLDAQGQLTP